MVACQWANRDAFAVYSYFPDDSTRNVLATYYSLNYHPWTAFCSVLMAFAAAEKITYPVQIAAVIKSQDLFSYSVVVTNTSSPWVGKRR